ncbi:ATP-binding protein [Candidatus Amarolinea aalborgensis]|uniref:sensor histidine kinase n=1 Tax=Candidatus Amarolinea aalborgensis TaxID=2249329 RepID=UPI003BF9B347
MINNELDISIAHLLFQERRLAYAMSDAALRVVRLGGELSLFGCADKDCVGLSVYDLVPELIGSEQEMDNILAGRQPRFELSWLNRDGEERTLYLNLINLPHRDAAGQINGLVHLLEDNTSVGETGQHLVQQRNELRLLRDQLLRQNQHLASFNAELKRMDEMKSMFVSIAAHELRSPLTSINGYLEMLLEGMFGALSQAQEEALHIIESSVKHLISITSNLLDATRLEAGRVELILVPSALPLLVQKVVTEMMPQLEAKEQVIEMTIAPDLPPVLCDRMRTLQIIGNLLDNACKYTARGGHISINLALAAEPGFALLAVSDTGVGISANDQLRLFNRFFRAESAYLTSEAGTGLGLHIARGLIELHGGRIWLESAVGRGTTFFVTFLIADEDSG